VCWGGVYNCTRAFLPMLQKAEEGHIVNTSSVNGFWASVGPHIPRSRSTRARVQSGNLSDEIDARQIAQARARIASMGRDVSSLSDDDIRKMVAERESRFREDAPTSAAEAATIILDGVKADNWRILVGNDAHQIDELVRQSPERAYDLDFFESFAAKAGWRIP
jgi:hypothetical protein